MMEIISKIGLEMLIQVDKADHPVVYVSWYAAAAYAKMGRTRGLPTETEWGKKLHVVV